MCVRVRARVCVHVHSRPPAVIPDETRVQEGGEVRREATAFVGVQIVPGPTPGERVEGYHAANELGHVSV